MGDQESNALRRNGLATERLELTRIHEPMYQKGDLNRFRTPTAARLVNIYLVRGQRNAWNSTLVGYHYGIEFDLMKAREKAEIYREAGTTIYIEVRDALWINFENANLMMVPFSQKDCLRQSRRLLQYVEGGCIINFLEMIAHLSFRWFAYYELAAWRPDLAGIKKRVKYRALSYGGGRPLDWAPPEPHDPYSTFHPFSEEFVGRCLGAHEVENLYEYIERKPKEERP